MSWMVFMSYHIEYQHQSEWYNYGHGRWRFAIIKNFFRLFGFLKNCENSSDFHACISAVLSLFTIGNHVRAVLKE